MTATLVIGPYSDIDVAGLKSAFDPFFLDKPADISGLEQTIQSQITAVAFKGHASFDGGLMDMLPNLKLIANYGVGYDAINI
ncbi:MAG: 2-hydroxyacid dehydrogenase, partial [SAR116 cluster bacterium]